MSYVVDTSVVVKWLVEEAGSAEAIRLIGEDLVAPDLLLAEVGNTAWKKWRRGEISAEQARAMPVSTAHFVRLLSSEAIASEALDLAMELNHPVYDCYFLAAAELGGRVLVTADKRLVELCRGGRFEKRVVALEYGA